MRPAPSSLVLSSRSHIADLDAARAVLRLLGPVLHSADVYRVGRWVVHDPSSNVAFDWLVTAIHLFRMSAFFWISQAPIPASRLSHGRDDVDVQPAAAGRPRPSVTGEHAEARPSTDWLWRIKLTNGQGPIRTGLSLKSQVFRITRADGSTPAPHQFRSHAELAGESRSPRPRREEANE